MYTEQKPRHVPTHPRTHIPCTHSPSGAAELERLFWAVSTPGTSEYLQFKTVAQLKAIIGAGEGTIEKAKSFLAAAGAHETVVSPLGDHVVGRFAAAEAALLTSTFGTFGPEEHKDPSFEFVLRRDLNKPQTFMSPKKQATAGAPGGEYAVNRGSPSPPPFFFFFQKDGASLSRVCCLIYLC